jgi:hypothetical protein
MEATPSLNRTFPGSEKGGLLLTKGNLSQNLKRGQWILNPLLYCEIARQIKWL